MDRTPACMISIESAAVPLYPAGSECTQKDTGAPGGSRLPRSKCMRGMARRVWLAGWASHRLELTATSPLIDLCTPVGKHTRGRPGKSRSCDGQGRRSVVTDKAGDHVTQHDARPALARSAPTHQAPVGYSPPWCSAHVRLPTRESGKQSVAPTGKNPAAQKKCRKG